MFYCKIYLIKDCRKYVYKHFKPIKILKLCLKELEYIVSVNFNLVLVKPHTQKT